MYIVETKDLYFRYPDGTAVLKGINFKVKKGEMVSLLGPNGAGKSTLFLHFNGILRPTKGEVLIKGKPIKYDKKSLVEVRKTVGLVFQNPDDQIFAPTVKEDVAFGPLNLGLPKEEVEKRVKEALKAVGMEGFENKPPHHLSGGQKKRVAIAGILAMQPEVIVLDEPTAGLDPVGASKIMKLLYDLNKKGMTIIISTHDVDLVPVYADKVYVMYDGKILKEGTPKEVFSDVETIRKANLRLPRVAHLIEILNKKDNIPIEWGFTIGEVRRNIVNYLKEKC
ncbi:TPA: ATP-binding cassette domain-containing protein [Methanocaldococcus jannaschii]|uniref:Energy-coupling factor transporter ATP-binding protein EcfA n=2 Tax=Methanocaldococcus jannaschii TaxID=2190 RepID=ECFA_METJA|nr:ATP-binding cassette domain-containing protein [Methanocaldococcus jannaschii]Q58488.1 RecName: Full=Energy-coupling factor transporter ATP-binding protein EcfA; Short=ECF transporter A component EcfA [Methanocaldococcus jannaschii DSM 2661]AAB99089.1 cobalt transport ATP-binding protein (cbiO) [Methanocaldococcus jannaschii DSM 2661]HII59490.1 ATP-binding cassette domain-containing protein [Methanocaldococcus jannaschii]